MARPAKPFLFQGWYCTDAGGPPRTKLCREAEGPKQAALLLAVHQLKLQEARAGRPAALRGRAVTAAEAHDLFLDQKQVEAAAETYHWYVDSLKPFFKRFGSRRLDSLTERDGLDYKRELSAPFTDRFGRRFARGGCSVNHYLRAAAALFNWSCAPGQDWLRRNPWKGLRRLHESSRERLLTEAEYQSLLRRERCPDWLDLLHVLRNATFRPGEVRHLAWPMVHWDEHQAVIPAAVVKTRKPRRVTLVDSVEAVLRRRHAADVAAGVPHGLVFPGPTGRPMTTKKLVDHWRYLVRKCVAAGEIEEMKNGERLVPYSNRHTRISELVRRGVPPLVVQAEAGHANFSMTQRYIHLTQQEVSKAVRESLASEPEA